MPFSAQKRFPALFLAQVTGNIFEQNTPGLSKFLLAMKDLTLRFRSELLRHLPGVAVF
jgi:hypothetical protein